MYIVKAVSLRRKNYYSTNPAHMGPLEGEIELRSGKNEIKLEMTAEQTQRIVAVLAEALVDTAKEAAAMISQQVIAQADGTQLLTAGE